MDIGKKLKELRLQNDLTLSDLASRSELTKGFLSQVERNQAAPSIATLEDILAVSYTHLDVYKRQRLTFADGIQDQMPKVLKPKQVLFEQADVEEFDSFQQTEGYYVYAYGELQGIYETAGDAIAEADRQSGCLLYTSRS